MKWPPGKFRWVLRCLASSRRPPHECPEMRRPGAAGWSGRAGGEPARARASGTRRGFALTPARASWRGWCGLGAVCSTHRPGAAASFPLPRLPRGDARSPGALREGGCGSQFTSVLPVSSPSIGPRAAGTCCRLKIPVLESQLPKAIPNGLRWERMPYG